MTRAAASTRRRALGVILFEFVFLIRSCRRWVLRSGKMISVLIPDIGFGYIDERINPTGPKSPWV